MAIFAGRGARRPEEIQHSNGAFVMAYQELHQQMPFQNPQQWGAFGFGQPQGGLGIQGVGYGLGQTAYGHLPQPGIGAWGQGPWGQSGWGGQMGWGQRHLSQQDVGEVVRQIVPLLPVMLTQAQQPMAAYGTHGYGPRMLTPHDVNEVVRQLLPIVPQLEGLLQAGQWPHQAGYGGIGQTLYGQTFQPFGQFSSQPGLQPFGQLGIPPYQSAFGAGQGWGPMQQRQLTQQDIGEVVRQLTVAIPQVISGLQAQRAI